MAAQLSDALRDCPYFSGLPEPVLAEIAAQGGVRAFAPGAIAFREAAPCAGLWLVLSGHLRSVRTSCGGRVQILRRFGPGSTMNDAAAFSGERNPSSAVAEDVALCWVLPREALQQTLAEQPQILTAAVGELAHKLRYMTRLAADLALQPVPARLARVLLQERRVDGTVDPVLDQRALAEMAGTVRQVANRALAQFARRGAIRLEHGRVHVTDAPALQRIAEGDENK